MKTTIIRLETHDDHVSVRDKMQWAKTGRVLLVWPRRGGMILSPLDLKIIAHHARQSGLQIALVSHKKRVLREAAKQGWPVFTSIVAAQKADWQQNAPIQLRRRRTNLRLLRQQLPQTPSFLRAETPFRRLAWFLLAFLAVMAIASIFIPSATINLPPETRTETLDLTLQLQPEVTTPQADGRLPLRTTRVVLEDSRLAASSGLIEVANEPAQGSLILTNVSAIPLDIPRGSLFHPVDSDFSFETLAFRHLDAGESAEVPIRAQTPGPEGNLPAGTQWVAAGDLGAALQAVNPAALEGGQTSLQRGPSASDWLMLRNLLLDDLQMQARETLQTQLTEGSLLLPGSVQLAEIYHETALPPEGQASRHLYLSLRAAYQAHYLTRADLRNLARQVLPLPDNLPNADWQVQIISRQPPIQDENGWRWPVTLSVHYQPHWTAAEIWPIVEGRRPARAAARLQAYLQLEAPPQIRLTPSWWPWLPWLPFRLTILTNGA